MTSRDASRKATSRRDRNRRKHQTHKSNTEHTVDSWLVEGKRPLLRKEGLTNNGYGMVGHGDRKIHRVVGTTTVAMCDGWIRAEAPSFCDSFRNLNRNCEVMIADINCELLCCSCKLLAFHAEICLLSMQACQVTADGWPSY